MSEWGPGLILPGNTTRPRLVSGRYYDSRSVYGLLGGSGAAMTANTLYASPFHLDYPTAFDRIGVNVTAAAAAGKLVKPLVYDAAADGLPGDLVHDPGSLAADAIAQVEATIALTLGPGDYHLCVISDGTPSLMAVSSFAPVFGQASVCLGNSGGSVQKAGQTLASPPNPFGAILGYVTNTLYLVGLRVA